MISVVGRPCRTPLQRPGLVVEMLVFSRAGKVRQLHYVTVLLWGSRGSRQSLFCLWASASCACLSSTSMPIHRQVVDPKIKAFMYTWGEGRITAEGERIPGAALAVQQQTWAPIIACTNGTTCGTCLYHCTWLVSASPPPSPHHSVPCSSAPSAVRAT